MVNAWDDVYCDFTKENKTYNAMYTSSWYWFVYHIVCTNSIIVRRYDGDTDLETLGNWWETRGVTLTKQ